MTFLRHALFRTTVAAWLLAAGLTMPARAQEAYPEDSASPDAAAFIQRFQDLAAGDPSVSGAVEAYLYPLTREVAPVEEPESEHEPAEPVEPRTLFFARGPGGGLTAVRAESFEKEDDVLIITVENGSKAIFQANRIAGQLPWYPDDQLEASSVDLEALAEQYEAVAERAPGLKRFLQTEVAKFRAILARRESGAREEKDNTQRVVDRITARKFDPSKNPSIPELSQSLVAAEAVIEEHPGAAAEIDEWARPYREHLGRLLVGDEWEDGSWVTAAERREREAREEAVRIRESIAYAIPAQAAAGAMVRSELMKPVWGAAGVVFLAGLALVFLRGTIVRGVAVAALAISPLCLAILFHLASRDPEGIPDVPASADETSVVELVAAAAGGNGTKPAKVDEDALNAFIARRIRIVEGDGEGWSRRALSVDLSPGRVTLFELVEGLGFAWIVRCDYAFLVENGKPALEPMDAWIGRVRCPSRLAEAFSGSVAEALGPMLGETRVFEVFQPEIPADGSVTLTPIGNLPRDSE